MTHRFEDRILFSLSDVFRTIAGHLLPLGSSSNQKLVLDSTELGGPERFLTDGSHPGKLQASNASLLPRARLRWVRDPPWVGNGCPIASSPLRIGEAPVHTSSCSFSGPPLPGRCSFMPPMIILIENGESNSGRDPASTTVPPQSDGPSDLFVGGFFPLPTLCSPGDPTCHSEFSRPLMSG
ncbi:hypothetical protein BO78DRAFT_84601 [Aspergillus sclerotiicarbonarius CBS 121057]|uniref:Uncharacterized protein n=1 Tax=Aspergillus sclerotiicarbonarius (strain CBS 121057 / IBT 28362) TaxID=1448318 RepID=A0A319EZ98_ASPSB|nr:hypothetical protein BO78DRAFT_84601 [Aspergillus sclerotiicarbonarius CBS 121057]